MLLIAYTSILEGRNVWGFSATNSCFLLVISNIPLFYEIQFPHSTFVLRFSSHIPLFTEVQLPYNTLVWVSAPTSPFVLGLAPIYHLPIQPLSREYLGFIWYSAHGSELIKSLHLFKKWYKVGLYIGIYHLIIFWFNRHWWVKLQLYLL